ncbi:MAG TPA: flavin reductase family protein [Nitrolancea sp.]|jgi:flavin reductase (DIM6/NTAB) family NADH-FMN oxidoreductase RutF|nr:flavin reductase family protein [Nitrolancea sp.]
MATKRQLDPRLAARLLQPAPLALITSFYRTQPNVMTAAWLMPVGTSPMLVGVAVHPARLTHEFVSRSELFAINIPTIELLTAVHRCGVESGRDRDKFLTARLNTMDANEIDVPLVEECVAHIECGVVQRISLTDHDLFIGEVLAASAVEELFTDRWTVQPDSELLHHIGSDEYATMANMYRARLDPEED